MLSDNGLQFKRILAIALLIFLISGQGAFCQGSVLDSLFTFRAGAVKTGNALNIITRQTGFNFTYDSELIDPENKTELTFSNDKLSFILDSILKNDSLVYTVIDKYIIISRIFSQPSGESKEPVPAEEADFISGIVVDDESRESLPYATIGLKNKGKGTVTNTNGEFRLTITHDCLTDTLSVSYLGYIGREIPVEQALGNNYTIRMKRDFISIAEIIIRTQVPQEIIYKTLTSIPRNYGNSPAMLTGFYREGVMKKQELQSYSEAIIQIYKSAYTGSLLNDQIKVLKSRKIENRDLDDTLSVRLKAGLSTCLELDGIRKVFDFISKESMPEYIYRMTDIVSTDGDAAYVIDFEQREGVDLPLYKGAVYISTDDFAILQADFELHPEHIHKMKNSFVSSSSRGFSTWPVTVKYSVSYRKVNERYFLNHVRGDLVFTSRQKKKFFSSQFNVFFELAVTDMNIKEVSRFDREELAPVHAIFSKTINSYDQEFWGNQDFLKPEDNLSQALKNMKVRLQEFSEPAD
ncbi:MAG: carboxypeptidase-like regulatory domain-containing protein [Bacteroidales bacterium]|jgi:hypothetical protein|nr:carboxypeptidase-like regulatory domain-containing protein [Bacteroidales bacterium]